MIHIGCRGPTDQAFLRSQVSCGLGPSMHHVAPSACHRHRHLHRRRRTESQNPCQWVEGKIHPNGATILRPRWQSRAKIRTDSSVTENRHVGLPPSGRSGTHDQPEVINTFRLIFPASFGPRSTFSHSSQYPPTSADASAEYATI